MHKKAHHFLSSLGAWPSARAKGSYAALWLSFLLVCVAALGYYSHRRVSESMYDFDVLSNIINATCLRYFGQDEFGAAYPVVTFLSMGDYKSSLFMYLFLLWSYAAGLTAEAARLLSMTLGLLGVAVATQLAGRLIDRGVYSFCAAPLLGFVLLSSWVLVPHRMPIEMSCSALAVGLFLSALYAALRQRASYLRGALLGVAWGILPYVYHSTKFLFLAAPVLVALALVCGEGRRVLAPSKNKALLTALAVGLLLCLPIFVDLATTQRVLTRYRHVQQVGFLNIVENYFAHCNPLFWFVVGDANPRHHSGLGGMLNPVLAPFLFAGLWAAVTRWRREKDAFIVLLPAFFLVGFVPASVSNEGLPHALRSLICLPPLILLLFLGAERLALWGRRLASPRAFSGVCSALFLSGALFSGWTLQHYYSKPLPDSFDAQGRPSIDPSWLGETRVIPCTDRSLDGIPYRYVRLVVVKDLCLCDPQYFRKEPWMDE